MLRGARQGHSSGCSPLEAAGAEGVVCCTLARQGKRHSRGLKRPRLAPPPPLAAVAQEDGWRPVTAEAPLLNTPASISRLIVRCMDADPAARPSFAEALDELNGPCKEEVGTTAPAARLFFLFLFLFLFFFLIF